jgi:hypothetical protein
MKFDSSQPVPVLPLDENNTDDRTMESPIFVPHKDDIGFSSLLVSFSSHFTLNKN